MSSKDNFSPTIAAIGFCMLAYTVYVAVTERIARNTSYRENTAITELRLSERKTNTLSLDQREDIFVRQVVPTFGLKTGSLDYNVLRTACTTGVYGSNADDFKVPAERVKATYELCGWKIGQ